MEFVAIFLHCTLVCEESRLIFIMTMYSVTVHYIMISTKVQNPRRKLPSGTVPHTVPCRAAYHNYACTPRPAIDGLGHATWSASSYLSG